MIVIGDVHGCYRTLLALIEQLPHRNLCFVGDLIDRGKHSHLVVQYVINNGYQCVLGNHEEMALDPVLYDLWYLNGGSRTVKGYGGFTEQLNEHIVWMKSLSLYIQYKNFIISHSYVLNVWDMDKGSDRFREECLWNREFDVNNAPSGLVNVFGHTSVSKIVQIDNQIMIDGGCVYNRKKSRLYAIDLDTMKTYEQKNIEWKPD